MLPFSLLLVYGPGGLGVACAALSGDAEASFPEAPSKAPHLPHGHEWRCMSICGPVSVAKK